MPGSFGLEFGTAVCAATVRVAVFAWELGASSSSASASLLFVLGEIAFYVSTSVSSSSSRIVGFSFYTIMALVELLF